MNIKIKNHFVKFSLKGFVSLIYFEWSSDSDDVLGLSMSDDFDKFKCFIHSVLSPTRYASEDSSFKSYE